MINITTPIQIKTSLTNNEPASLLPGELAYSNVDNNNKIYIGNAVGEPKTIATDKRLLIISNITNFNGSIFIFSNSTVSKYIDFLASVDGSAILGPIENINFGDNPFVPSGLPMTELTSNETLITGKSYIVIPETGLYKIDFSYGIGALQDPNNLNALVGQIALGAYIVVFNSDNSLNRFFIISNFTGIVYNSSIATSMGQETIVSLSKNEKITILLPGLFINTNVAPVNYGGFLVRKLFNTFNNGYVLKIEKISY